MPQDVQFCAHRFVPGRSGRCRSHETSGCRLCARRGTRKPCQSGQTDLASIVVLNKWVRIPIPGVDAALPGMARSRPGPHRPGPGAQSRGLPVSLNENVSLTRDLHIYGFNVPANYTPVEDMLHELRMPPFDEAPTFTTQDVWRKYYRINVAGLATIGLLLLLWIRLLQVNRRLKTEKNWCRNKLRNSRKAKTSFTRSLRALPTSSMSRT